MKRLGLLGALTGIALTLTPNAGWASSHREAPFITKNPKIDGADFYLFNSYQASRQNFVTAIANYLPLQDAYGGPNYFSLDPEALYEIHFDNTGDGVEDITFQFKFQTSLLNDAGVVLPIAQPDGGNSANIAIPLINAGPIGLADGGFIQPGGFQGQAESFTVNVVRGGRRSGTSAAVTKMVGGGTVFAKPFDNIGSKTFPANSYSNYAKSFIYDVSIPGCSNPAKIFVGQRADGFAVNLGTIFDLVNAPAGVITDEALRGAAPNTIAGKNVTSLAIEIDKSCIGGASGIVGGWTTASVRQARVINPNATFGRPSREGGAWTQVSRLGNPLVNEVVIGVPDKDKFNSSEPKDDGPNFAKYITNPTLPALIQVLFGVQAPTAIPRNDLVTVFAQGVPSVNRTTQPDGGAPAVAEYLRLNTGVPATPFGMQNNLGALGCFTGRTATAGPSLSLTATDAGVAGGVCDPAGFPNGRRPGDDVVDIALRASMGYLLSTNDAPVGAVPFHDAVNQTAAQFDQTFPYLKDPTPGTP